MNIIQFYLKIEHNGDAIMQCNETSFSIVQRGEYMIHQGGSVVIDESLLGIIEKIDLFRSGLHGADHYSGSKERRGPGTDFTIRPGPVDKCLYPFIQRSIDCLPSAHFLSLCEPG